MKAKNFLMNLEDVLQTMSSQKIIGFIIIISLLVFSPVFMGAEFLTYDDNWYIYQNPNVIHLSWQSVVNIFTIPHDGQYSPLGELYCSIVYSLFGPNATAFKICSLLVHLLNIFFLFKILTRVFEDKLLITVVVLLFAIHPMQVETIGWISAIFRNAVFLMFLGYLFYLDYLEKGFKVYRLIPVFLCYVLAFLTKEQAILFPVGLFLIHMFKTDTIRTKRFIVEMIGWTIVAITMVALTIKITEAGGPNLANRSVAFYENLVLLFEIIVKYCYNYLFPYQLSFSYPTPKNFLNGWVINVIGAIAILVVGVLVSLKNKISKFGFLWSLGFLSMALTFSFMNVRKTYMADRYVYVGIIGLSVLFYQIILYFKRKTKNKILFNGILMLFMLSFCVLSFQRIIVFKNNKNVWSQAATVNTKDYLAMNNLATVYLKSGRYDTAIEYYKNALEANPNYSLSHNNITKAYYDQQKYDSALYHVSKAIAISPNYVDAYKNRSAVYYALGKDDLYVQDLNVLIQLLPNNLKYKENRAQSYFKQKKYKESLQDALELLKNPSYQKAEIFSLTGNNLLLLQRYKEADALLSKAIKHHPKGGKNLYLRSVARVKSGRWIEALQDAVKAKKVGYLVDDQYYNMLVREVVKRNK